MVERVEAFKDSSGTVHLDEATAARAEAKLQLEKILGKGADVCVLAIMQHAKKIYLVLNEWNDVGLPSWSEDEPAKVGETGQTLDERYPGRADTTVQDIATGGDQ